jgi:hypothetical protein
MVIWPWKMMYAVVDFGVGIACALGTKFKDAPVVLVFRIQKVD